jgi:hypothetical protein
MWPFLDARQRDIAKIKHEFRKIKRSSLTATQSREFVALFSLLCKLYIQVNSEQHRAAEKEASTLLTTCFNDYILWFIDADLLDIDNLTKIDANIEDLQHYFTLSIGHDCKQRVSAAINAKQATIFQTCLQDYQRRESIIQEEKTANTQIRQYKTLIEDIQATVKQVPVDYQFIREELKQLEQKCINQYDDLRKRHEMPITRQASDELVAQIKEWQQMLGDSSVTVTYFEKSDRSTVKVQTIDEALIIAKLRLQASWLKILRQRQIDINNAITENRIEQARAKFQSIRDDLPGWHEQTALQIPVGDQIADIIRAIEEKLQTVSNLISDITRRLQENQLLEAFNLLVKANIGGEFYSRYYALIGEQFVSFYSLIDTYVIDRLIRCENLQVSNDRIGEFNNLRSNFAARVAITDIDLHIPVNRAKNIINLYTQINDHNMQDRDRIDAVNALKDILGDNWQFCVCIHKIEREIIISHNQQLLLSKFARFEHDAENMSYDVLILLQEAITSKQSSYQSYMHLESEIKEYVELCLIEQEINTFDADIDNIECKLNRITIIQSKSQRWRNIQQRLTNFLKQDVSESLIAELAIILNNGAWSRSTVNVDEIQTFIDFRRRINQEIYHSRSKNKVMMKDGLDTIDQRLNQLLLRVLPSYRDHDIMSILSMPSFMELDDCCKIPDLIILRRIKTEFYDISQLKVGSKYEDDARQIGACMAKRYCVDITAQLQQLARYTPSSSYIGEFERRFREIVRQSFACTYLELMVNNHAAYGTFDKKGYRDIVILRENCQPAKELADMIYKYFMEYYRLKIENICSLLDISDQLQHCGEISSNIHEILAPTSHISTFIDYERVHSCIRCITECLSRIHTIINKFNNNDVLDQDVSTLKSLVHSCRTVYLETTTSVSSGDHGALKCLNEFWRNHSSAIFRKIGSWNDVASTDRRNGVDDLYRQSIILIASWYLRIVGCNIDSRSEEIFVPILPKIEKIVGDFGQFFDGQPGSLARYPRLGRDDVEYYWIWPSRAKAELVRLSLCVDELQEYADGIGQPGRLAHIQRDQLTTWINTLQNVEDVCNTWQNNLPENVPDMSLITHDLHQFRRSLLYGELSRICAEMADAQGLAKRWHAINQSDENTAVTRDLHIVQQHFKDRREDIQDFLQTLGNFHLSTDYFKYIRFQVDQESTRTERTEIVKELSELNSGYGIIVMDIDKIAEIYRTLHRTVGVALPPLKAESLKTIDTIVVRIKGPNPVILNRNSVQWCIRAISDLRIRIAQHNGDFPQSWNDLV